VNLSSALAPGGASSTVAPSSSNAASALGSDDFFQLLVTQLTNQDPLEPTGNEELLKQISSIREIELSTTLTESLERLTGQQHFAAASGLIGQYVTGTPGDDGSAASGLVIGVRFAEGGRAILQLSSGAELPVEQLSTVRSPLDAAQALVGLQVVGVDRSDAAAPQLREGVVASVGSNARGEPRLELDTGDAVDLRDVISIAANVE
jgi:flagellar basal-body rod modification protein FlgD